MSSSSKLVGVVIAVAIAFILIGHIMPIGISGMEDSKTDTYTLAESEVITDLANTNITLDDVEDSSGDINLTIEDTTTGTTYSIDNLAVDSESTKTVGDLGDITVKNVDQVSNTEAEIDITHAVEYGWDSATQNVFGILSIFGVLVLLGVLAGWVIKTVKLG